MDFNNFHYVVIMHASCWWDTTVHLFLFVYTSGPQSVQAADTRSVFIEFTRGCVVVKALRH
jgi:hypothetical protein